ncbi:MAG: hypothetical protein HY055_12695 [Magnetospirillum sp.]|nr:hypothetical protein [Magnetospirillum sp.]
MAFDDDSALADIFEEFARPFLLTPPAGAPVAVFALFWERSPEARLDTLRKPHDGPAAEIRLADLAAAGLSEIERGSLLAAQDAAMPGRSFAIARAARTKGGFALRLDLDEQS